RAAAVKEGRLKSVQSRILSKTLDRGDACAGGLLHRNKAAIHKHAVHQHGARPALAFTATFLSASQNELATQHVQEAFHRIHEYGLRLAIDGERYFAFARAMRRQFHCAPLNGTVVFSGSSLAATASKTSSGSKGMALNGMPVASSTAFTIAGAGPSMGSSPM